MQETAEEQLQGRMLDIFNNVNACIDHVPPVGTEYEFEVRRVHLLDLPCSTNVCSRLGGVPESRAPCPNMLRYGFPCLKLCSLNMVI